MVAFISVVVVGLCTAGRTRFGRWTARIRPPSPDQSERRLTPIPSLVVDSPLVFQAPLASMRKYAFSGVAEPHMRAVIRCRVSRLVPAPTFRPLTSAAWIFHAFELQQSYHSGHHPTWQLVLLLALLSHVLLSKDCGAPPISSQPYTLTARSTHSQLWIREGTGRRCDTSALRKSFVQLSIDLIEAR